MPCRHAAGDRSDGGIDGENFQRTALAIGGRRALASLLERTGEPSLFPADPVPDDRRDRQHAWSVGDAGPGGCPVDHEGTHHRNRRDDVDDGDRSGDGGDRSGDDAECPVDHGEGGRNPDRSEDAHGGDNVGGDADREDADGDGEDGDAPPFRYHLLLYLDYEGDVPDGSDRRAVETALADLETAFGWGPDGLAFTLGYSRRYFDRFESGLPDELAAALGAGERAVVADGGRGGEVPDALLHLASDDARVLLAAELALWGEDPLVDFSLGATLSGTFARPSDPPYRRVAVATGEGAVPEAEEAVALAGNGPFAGGAIQRVVSRPPAGNESASAPDAGGCPAHGDGASDPTDGWGLRSLAPSDPFDIDVTVGGLAAPTADGHRETYLVPPVSGRSLPTPTEWETITGSDRRGN